MGSKERRPMAERIHPFCDSRLARIEPDDRLVVLARTIQARDPGTEAELKDSAVNWARFGETCLGQALYRHRSVFRNASEAAVLPSRTELLSRHSSCRRHSRARGQAATAGDATAARGDSVDHPLGLHTAAKLAGLDRSARTAGVAGIHRGAIALSWRLQRHHAEIYRPGCGEARRGEQDWDAQDDGDGGSALP